MGLFTAQNIFASPALPLYVLPSKLKLPFSKNDAAILIEEKDFTGERLIKEVDALVADPERLKTIGENARKMAIYDATERIVNCICEIVK